MKSVSRELAAAIRPLEMKLKLLWIGVFPSLGVYIYLAWIRSQNSHGYAATASQLLLIIVLLGLMVLVQSLIFRWFTLSPRAIANMLNGNQPSWVKAFANPDAPKANGMLKPEVHGTARR